MLKDIDKVIEEHQTKTQKIIVSSEQVWETQRKMNDAGYLWEYDKKAHEALAEHFVKMQRGDSRGLALLGNVGTGKTFFCQKFFNIRMFTAAEIVNLYQDKGYGDDFAEVVHDVYTDTDIDIKTPPRSLIIDDLGAEPVGKRYGETREVLMEVLAERYTYWQSSGVRTVITSNFSGAQLDERYGRRITDRIREMCAVIYFQGDSARAADQGETVEGLEQSQQEG